MLINSEVAIISNRYEIEMTSTLPDTCTVVYYRIESVKGRLSGRDSELKIDKVYALIALNALKVLIFSFVALTLKSPTDPPF